MPSSAGCLCICACACVTGYRAFGEDDVPLQSHSVTHSPTPVELLLLWRVSIVAEAGMAATTPRLLLKALRWTLRVSLLLVVLCTNSAEPGVAQGLVERDALLWFLDQQSVYQVL